MTWRLVFVVARRNLLLALLTIIELAAIVSRFIRGRP